jgi:hypothetical protein
LNKGKSIRPVSPIKRCDSFPIFLLPDPIQKVVDEPERNIVPRVELTLPLPEEKLLVDPLLFDLVFDEGDLFGGGEPVGLGIGLVFELFSFQAPREASTTSSGRSRGPE